MLDVGGRNVAVRECGRGHPLVYLHGFADVHRVADDVSHSTCGSARSRA